MLREFLRGFRVLHFVGPCVSVYSTKHRRLKSIKKYGAGMVNSPLLLNLSITQGTVTAALMLRNFGSYPHQNSLVLALREFGRIKRSLLILTGGKASSCSAACGSGSTRAKPATRSLMQFSFTS